jgi:hypothetical protein
MPVVLFPLLLFSPRDKEKYRGELTA